MLTLLECGLARSCAAGSSMSRTKVSDRTKKMFLCVSSRVLLQTERAKQSRGKQSGAAAAQFLRRL